MAEAPVLAPVIEKKIEKPKFFEEKIKFPVNSKELLDFLIAYEKEYKTYILHYHYRASNPLTKIFRFLGPLTEAIERGRVHCDIMNYRFIKVRPFIVDLTDQERVRNDDQQWPE